MLSSIVKLNNLLTVKKFKMFKKLISFKKGDVVYCHVGVGTTACQKL